MNRFGFALPACVLSVMLLTTAVSAYKGEPHHGDSDTSAVTAAKAQEIALEKAGGGTVMHYQSDYDHGEKVYDITILDGDVQYTMDIGASTGQIYEFKEEKAGCADGAESHSSDTATSSAGISAENAKRIALEKAGGGTVIKCHLDYLDGQKIYIIRIIDGETELSFEIDADTGSILEHGMDFDN